MEVLPLKHLRLEDAPIFGSLVVSLASLKRSNLSCADGVVISPPDLHLKTLLEHYDFETKEVIEQSLTLVKKEIEKIPIPEELSREIKEHGRFFVSGQEIKSAKSLWLALLNIWLEEIKGRLWQDGFKESLTENLQPQIVVFLKKLEAFGSTFFDETQDDTILSIHRGKLEPKHLKQLHDLVLEANKKLLIPHEYEWILDGEVKLVGVKPFTAPVIASVSEAISRIASSPSAPRNDERRSAIKVFLDLSTGLVVEREVDGVYIASEKIFDLNKPRDSFEDLAFRLVESSQIFQNKPVFFKLADKSEGMGKIRGTLRLLHQKSLFEPMVDIIDFVRHKKGLSNIHLVIPFVRSANEFLQIKRELAVKGLSRKSSMRLFLELAVPENIINLENYLEAGLDGVFLNLDELIAHLNGFDHTQEDLMFYKNEVTGLLKFLEDGLKLLHKSKIPFIATGSIHQNPEVLAFLVEKGVHGMVMERFEARSAHELLHQAEKRMILRRAQ